MNTNQDPVFYPSDNPQPVLRVDLTGLLLYANSASDSLLTTWSVSLGEKLPKAIQHILNATLEQDESFDLEVQTARQFFLLQFVPFINRGYVNVYGFDISPRKQFQHKIQHLELYDALTDLPNRNLMEKKLTQQIEIDERTDQRSALLTINLDNFKSINHTLGHNVADGLLCAVSNRLAECVPFDYTLARLGQDEFAVLRPNIHEDADASNLAQVILDNLTQPFLVQNHDIVFTSSIGICIFPVNNVSPDEVLSHAALALTRAKKIPGSHYHFYKSYMSSVAQARRSLFKDLRHAIARNELRVFYQPQIDLKKQSIEGAEALVRWQHPEHGLLTPMRFTQLAEEQGIIREIGEWVLHNALTQTKQWHDAGYSHLSIAVNLSALQFQHYDLVKHIEKVLKEKQFPAKLLELEILEDVLIKNLKRAKKVIQSLKQLGVKVAIDDFGTGYSSLNYLQQLPIDKIKLDRSFIQAMSDPTQEVSLIEDVINIGHKLKLSVLAEGVESQHEYDFLLKHQCDLMQGFFISEAIRGEDFTALLKTMGR